MNPANYTVWEYRRRILLSLKTPLVNEHHFVKTFLYEHPKNYQLWYHCQWLMEQIFKEDSPKEVFKKPESEQFQTLSRELDLVKTVLADDTKNYHAWQYRRWLVDFFAIPPSNELEFCGALLREDIFNNSAWNHRFYTVIEEGLDGAIFDRELQFAEEAIRASPNNQSACNYLIGILSPLPRLAPDESGQLTAVDDLPSEANLLRVREFIEDTIAQDISGAAESPALLSLLVEVLYDFLRILHKKCGGKAATAAAGTGDEEKAEDTVRQLISLCDRLALELDRVRANYWRYRSPMTRFFPNPYLTASGEAVSLQLSEADVLSEAVKTVSFCLADRSTRASVRDGCLYTGCIGIAWAAIRVARTAGTNPEVATRLLQDARQLVEQTLHCAAQDAGGGRRADREQQLAFLVGLPGVWLVAATLYHHLGLMAERNKYITKYAELSPHFVPESVFPQGSDELFIGRAGYLCGLYELQQTTGEEVVSNDVIFSICDAILTSGQRYAAKHHSSSPLMYSYHGTEYLGAAHGLCGILFALLLFPAYLATRGAPVEDLVKGAVDYLLSVTPEDTGNLPAATDELPPHHRTPERHELVHWCHGAAGAVYVYAKAYGFWHDKKYLEAARRCADVVWHRGFLKKGPGICHGIAGSGYTQLVLYRLTGEARYLQRATAFAEFLQNPTFKREARRPDCPLSLYEGLAGTACFLADLSQPSTAAFPLMNPF
ncbi:LanC-like protein 3 [Sparganum proliferum]